MSDLISRQQAIDALCSVCNALGGGHNCDKTKFVYNAPFDEQVILCPEHYALTMLPSAQPERLTDDDFETIRIHLNAYKEKLCNQQRWEEAEEYQRIIDRFMAFASAQPEMNCSEIPNNWIPCSERLPEIDKEVLVTDGELCWVCSLFESQDIEDGLYQWEDNYGHWHDFETWVAWMPLPEPYQEGGTE